MKSLYGQYIKERINQEIIETKHGFLTYTISNTDIGPKFFVHDLFVVKEKRFTGEGKELVEKAHKIAEEFKCTHTMATIDPKTFGATEAMLFHIKQGMSLLGTEDGLIYMFMLLPYGEKDGK